MAMAMAMAMSLLHLPLTSPISSFTTTQSLPSHPKFYVLSQMITREVVEPVVRRSASYQPSIWNYEFVQSLTSEFMEEKCLNKRDMLIKEVKIMLIEDLVEDPLRLLELVDELQRLGVSYHFEKEINQILKNMNERFQSEPNYNKGWKNHNLYATALLFRILRQHGYHIPQEVFKELKEEIEKLSICVCEEKIKGMLSLYEASFLAIEGESFLDEARQFTVEHLSNYLKSSSDEMISTIVRHALELPIHWRMPRLEARWFVDMYGRRSHKNLILLELAKLDFNIVQSTHQDELKYVSRWWKGTGIGEKLEFARDRLMANFFWSVGMSTSDPCLGHFRKITTKIASLITIIDDVYDVYGTLDELELFTHAVERWDIDAIDMLPYYMKICFVALYNTINEVAFDVLRDQGVKVIQYLRKVWVDLCRTFFIEAKWYYTNYKPTFQEYLENSWISVSGPLLLLHAYVFVTKSITKEDLEGLEDYPDVVRYSSMIFRLSNDLATSSDEAERGDVAKSLQCYMNDTGASEHEARMHIKSLIVESWKKMNQVQNLSSSPYFSPTFFEIASNLARIAHTVYQHRDGHTVEDHETKDHVSSLFIKPI